MSSKIQDDQWIWIVIQNPGKDEHFLGQHDEDKNESFIPTFVEKEEAEKALPFLVKEEGCSYEIQAIRYDDLVERASKEGFLIMVLDGSGRVITKS
jgi:hypothetical protein